MKTKLLFNGFFILLLVSGQLQAQNQLWMLTRDGGANNGGTIIKANSDGSGATVAFNFQPPDGYTPYGDLLLASDDNLYGTCFNGGSFGSCTCFRYEPSTGTYTDVYDFDIAHGDYPRSGMIEGPNGILYGAASGGGIHGGGVIYSYNMATGTYTDLVDLESATGSYPIGSPVLCNGKLYGMTMYGGANSRGVIYRYDIATDYYSDVLDFGGPATTTHEGNLMLASNGLLYGMGSGNGLTGDGVLFSFDPVSKAFVKLHDFNGTDGRSPKGGLIEASNGLLYGMTSAGGITNNGTIFSFDISTGVLNSLYSFNGADGREPWGNLKQSGTLLCGTTFSGGAGNLGVIFNYDITTGMYTKLLDFNATNGSGPTGGFISYHATGIGQLNNDEAISIFPNPVSNYLYITSNVSQTENATLYLKDLTGKIIHASSCKMHNNQPEKIDLTGYSKGTYLLEIRSAGGTVVKKIVKI